MQQVTSNNLDPAILCSINNTRHSLDAVQLCGIYFLYDGDELVYIGRARDIFSRVYCHATERTKTFDSFAYHIVPAEQLPAVEEHCINAFWPTRYNRVGGKAKQTWYSYGVRTSITGKHGRYIITADYYDHRHDGPGVRTRRAKARADAEHERQVLLSEVLAYLSNHLWISEDERQKQHGDTLTRLQRRREATFGGDV